MAWIMTDTLILGISYLLTWTAQSTACSKCLALNGQQWTVDNLDLIPSIHDLVSHPNCKCEMDIEIMVNPSELQVWSV